MAATRSKLKLAEPAVFLRSILADSTALSIAVKHNVHNDRTARSGGREEREGAAVPRRSAQDRELVGRAGAGPEERIEIPRVRRDHTAARRGGWGSLERCIEQRSEADSSHGVCPECYEKHLEPQRC